MLRWIHKSWKVFWEIILTIVVLIIVLGGIGIGLLQLNSTKGIIANKIETKFNQSHKGTLSIGDLNGFLPFNVELENVSLTYSLGSTPPDTLINVESARVNINLWSLWNDKLSISSLKLIKPTVRLLPNGSGGYTLSAALSSTHGAKNKKKKKGSSFIPTVAISAPEITIKNGTFYTQKPPLVSSKIKLPAPFKISNIDAQLFINFDPNNRFVNIDQLSGYIHHINAGKFAVSGQIFSNNKTLEFNGFQLSLGSSQIQLNGKISNIDIAQQNIQKQIKNATFDLNVQSNRFLFTEFNDVLPKLPDINKPLSFAIHITGDEHAIHLKKLKTSVGKSYASLHGKVSKLFEKNNRSFVLHIDTLNFNNQVLKELEKSIDSSRNANLQYLSLSGDIRGNADSVSVHLSGSSRLGSLTFNASGTLASPYSFEGSIKGSTLDASALFASRVDTTSLNFSVQFSGRHFSPDNLKQGQVHLKIRAKNSLINNVQFDHLHLTATLHQGKLDADYLYRYNRQKISGAIAANFNRKQPHFRLKGNVVALNLSDYLDISSIDSTNLNTTYQIVLNGMKPKHMYGSLRLNIEKSRINGRQIKSHHLKLKLTSPDLPQNSLTVSSPFFGLLVRGDVDPVSVLREAKYWSTYFKNRVNKEILLDSTYTVEPPEFTNVQPVGFEGHFVAKNVPLIKKYFPGFPTISSNSIAKFQLSADSINLQFTSNVLADTLSFNDIRIKGGKAQISGKFNHSKTLKESGKLTVNILAEQLNTGLASMDSVSLQLHYRKNSLDYSQQIGNISNNAEFNLDLYASLAKDDIKVTINNFFLGNKHYFWHTVESPTIIYNRSKKIKFHSFKIKNGDGYLALRGTLSPAPSDTLHYIVHHVSLNGVSDLINGRFSFSGILNGNIRTSSLTRSPSFQGNLSVDRFTLEGRPIGDVTLSAILNKKKRRYDTTLKIQMDSTEYQTYLAKNNGIGQDILVSGYFVPAGLRNNSNTLLHFNADINEMGTWFTELFLSNVFKQVHGAAHGTAKLTGTLNKPDIKAKVNLDDVDIQIGFMGTTYTINGLLTFNNHKRGLVFNHLKLNDQQGGTGFVSGNVDFNNFKPTKYLHLKVTMNDLKFVNSQFSLSTPFFGDASASGAFRLDGPTTNLTLKSLDVIRISPNSMFGYPLMTKTPLYANSNFIKFVESLKHPQKTPTQPKQKEKEKQPFFNNDHSLTFAERFNLDLQFMTQGPINFRVIFDPVTNEHITAQGTGRMRLIMHEGNTQLFGHFTITGGTYQFVVAGIFSRKFSIMPGGSIIWEGKPTDARINMHAVYTARPTVASLLNTSQQKSKSARTFRRIPVNMIIHMSGELQHPKLSIHFELPSTFSIASSSQISYILNQINSNRQESFKQAASIFVTGNFIPTGFSSNQSKLLASSLSSGSTYIGPLLSNQIINPLISQQINSLFNNGWAHFSFDFRLNEFNQIGLGISLSLLNGQLVLRRDGLLTTGELHYTTQERIGNLSATYYFNNQLSLLAFHRQDLFLGSNFISNSEEVSPGLVPDVNGVGIKTHIQFNTWQQLRHKVRNFFRRLLGKEEINFRKRKKDSTKKQASTKKHHGNPKQSQNGDELLQK